MHPPSPTVAGTDTKKFNRTPEMAVEALKRYPCAATRNPPARDRVRVGARARVRVRVRVRLQLGFG